MLSNISRHAFPSATSLLNLGRHSTTTKLNLITQSRKMSLSADEVARYSRQLILPELGVEGQLRLKDSSILIVGCGGLGCPAAQYLAAAGIGTIGLVDGDVVEKSNLHRQVLHREDTIGELKTKSIADSLKKLNSNIEFVQIDSRLTRENALKTIDDFDIVLDATDNAMTRYLLSDACVLAKKPLVSGAALRFEGQLTVYNYDEKTPCYRCLFPNPPPPETVTNCSDGGVLGVVPGIIGSLEALEAIKIAAGISPSFAGKMLLFDALTGAFRNIKIRSRRKECVSCGENPTITRDLIDYEAFVKTPQCPNKGEVFKILLPFERVTNKEYKEQILDANIDHVLIDCRPKVEADIVKLPNAVNIPLGELSTDGGLNKVRQLIAEKKVKEVYVMCRRGNASQKAVRVLKDRLTGSESDLEIKDIIGGISMWSEQIDPSVPTY